MTDLRNAAKQALEALEYLDVTAEHRVDNQVAAKAIAALKRALAEDISPQREWVGLTDEELLEAAKIAEKGNYLVAFQRIQQKLKEKNA